MFLALVTIYTDRRSAYALSSTPLWWLPGKPVEGSTSFKGINGKSEED